MSRRILLSLVLILLLQSCTLAVGVNWPNWARMPGGPAFSYKERETPPGPPNQNQGIEGFQLAYAGSITGQSGIGQITKAAGEQFQNITDTAILQHQSGGMLVGQIAGTIGAGHAGGIQHFNAHQHQAATSLVGNSIQNTSIGVTQFSNVFGAPDSKAFAGGMVVVSTTQTQYVN